MTGDLVFGEGPRWRDGVLWFSDMHGESVWTVDLSGRRTKVLDVSGRRPSGLGFLPNGDLLIVSMLEAEILRWDGTDLTTYADLTPLFVKGCNDMVVDMNGRAYVGSFPDVAGPVGRLVAVDPDGSARVVADQIVIPNGSVIGPDGTFIVAESLGRRLTAFDIEQNGDLFKSTGICRMSQSGPRWNLPGPGRRRLGGHAIGSRISTDNAGGRGCRCSIHRRTNGHRLCSRRSRS